MLTEFIHEIAVKVKQASAAGTFKMKMLHTVGTFSGILVNGFVIFSIWIFDNDVLSAQFV